VNVGNYPVGAAVSPDGTKVYVANSDDNTTTVIDTSTNVVTATVSVGEYPSGVVVAPDGTKVYVASSAYQENSTYNSIASVIDAATNTVIASVPVGAGSIGVAVSPDGKNVYLANFNDNTASVIDTSTNTVTATVPVGVNPVGVAVSPDGTKVYVANSNDSTVSVIDATTNTVTATVPVGIYPFGVSTTSDGKNVYVTNAAENTASVLDATTNNVTTTIPVGELPLSLGQFIGGPVTVSNNITDAGTGCKEVKDYLPKYTNGVDLNIINEVGSDILVVWTKADSKKPVFKVNIPTGENRTIKAPTGSFDDYIRVGCSWYRAIQNNGDHKQLKSGYGYTFTYYWGSNGTALEPINDGEAPE
jgi:YVTN family beta-propeller protein